MRKLNLQVAQGHTAGCRQSWDLESQVSAPRSSSIFPQASNVPASIYLVSGFNDASLKVYPLLKTSEALAGDLKKKRKCQRERPTHETSNGRSAGRHRTQQPASSAALCVINKLSSQSYEPWTTQSWAFMGSGGIWERLSLLPPKYSEGKFASQPGCDRLKQS